MCCWTYLHRAGLATPTDLQSPRCLVGLHKNLIKIPPDFHQRQIVIGKASLWGVRNLGIEVEFRCRVCLT